MGPEQPLMWSHYYWGNSLLSTLLDALILRFLYSVFWDCKLLSILCELQQLFFWWFIPPGLVVSAYSPQLKTWGELSSDLWISLSLSPLISMVLYSANSSHWVFSNSQLCLSTQGDHRALPSFHPSVLLMGNSLQAVSWDNHGAHLFCFLSGITVHMLPVVRCLKLLFQIFCPVF